MHPELLIPKSHLKDGCIESMHVSSSGEWMARHNGSVRICEVFLTRNNTLQVFSGKGKILRMIPHS
jgi:hypothetical protein